MVVGVDEKISKLIKEYEKEAARLEGLDNYLDCCDSTSLNQRISDIEDFVRDLKSLKNWCGGQ